MDERRTSVDVVMVGRGCECERWLLYVHYRQGHCGCGFMNNVVFGC